MRMKTWKTIFHPLQRLYRNASLTITKVLHIDTKSDAAILTLHLNRTHQRCQLGEHHHHRNHHYRNQHLGPTSQFLSVRNSGRLRDSSIGRTWRRHNFCIFNDTKFAIYNVTSSLNFTSNSSSVIPAVTRKPVVQKVLGRQWLDEYAWMQEGLGLSEELHQYIKVENNFHEQYFNSLKALQEKLKADILLWEEVDYDMAREVKVIGDYAYYPDLSENGSGIFCRRNIRTGEDQVLLDSNHLMRSFDYNKVIVTGFKISPCQQYLGAVVERSPDVYDGHIIKMESSRQSHLVECIQNISNLEFLDRGSVLYTKPFNLQAREVWIHHVGTSQQRDELVFEETDERYFVDLSHTKDRRYVVINSNSRTTSELWLMDSRGSPSEAEVKLVWPRQEGVECYLDHCGHTLFALTNAGESSELQLLKAQTSDDIHCSSTIQLWEELFIPPSGHVIQDMDVFASHCVVALLVDNVPQLAVIKYSGEVDPLYVEIPSVYTTIIPSLNADVNSTRYQFQLTSPLQPPKNFELDLQTCNIEIGENEDDDEEDDEGLDADSCHSRRRRSQMDFTCKRLMAQSQDGTMVPVTVFHKEDLALNNQHPMLVIGYGAYGRNVEMAYTAERMALLSAGWVLAFCHVRGGGELGKQWYCSGKADQKHHSFEDFISCIEFLHSSGFSQPSLTAGWAASAGALLLGVICNQRPDLLRAAVMRMPYVDVLSSMLDPSSPLTSQDIEEWGDPSENAADLEYISAYCPYHNIRSQAYPSILMTSSMDDQRVPAWLPAKYMARLRDRTRDQDSLPTFLMRVYSDGGHFGPDEGDGGVDQAAMEWAFLHRQLSLDGCTKPIRK